MPAWLVPAIGAGAGLLGSLFGGKPSPDTSTSTFTPDKNSLAQLEAYRRMAQQYQQRAGDQLNQGPLRGALSGYNMMAGNLGYGMQRGTQGVEQFFDPFQGQVIGGLQQDFDRMRGLAYNQAGDQAIGAGAFGGDRRALLEAAGQRDIGQLESNTLAGVRSQGYNTALDRLMAERMQAANLGFQGLQGMQGVAGQFQGDQLAALQAMLAGVGGGGYTTNTTATQGYTPPNPFAGALGGAATAMGMFPGGGGAVPPGGGAGLGFKGMPMPNAWPTAGSGFKGWGF
jgi:hypothetical protein